MSLTKNEITAVKSRGFLLNRGTECFSGRVVSIAGAYTANELKIIANCAEKFGTGKVIFTSRLSAEIVGIPYENIPLAEEYMNKNGLSFGGTGAKIRPITACKGTTCIFGNIDTQSLAKEIHNRFYVGINGVKLPHKFKIGVGGCPNSCMKPSLNDVGIEGCREVSFDYDKCRGCSKCNVAENCPSKAVSVIDEKAVTDKNKCTSCGVCVGKCPFGAIPREARSLCRVFVGGTWGKTQRMGTLLPMLFEEGEITDVIYKIILWYKENGYQKERLGATIDRIGLNSLINAITSDDITKRADEILSADIKIK